MCQLSKTESISIEGKNSAHKTKVELLPGRLRFWVSKNSNSDYLGNNVANWDKNSHASKPSKGKSKFSLGDWIPHHRGISTNNEPARFAAVCEATINENQHVQIMVHSQKKTSRSEGRSCRKWSSSGTSRSNSRVGKKWRRKSDQSSICSNADSALIRCGEERAELEK